ncbi:alpha/beta fold hydrolase [Flavobacteriaceae bacterium R38]|nr:alpha/beta fold hydrolase [Flavobacteriaceae bacterium R38]
MRSLLFFFLFIPLIISCNQDTKGKANTLSFTQQFGSFENIEEGYLEVPENRTLNNGKTIKLAYVVLKARNQNAKKNPVLYLQGGPGAPTLIMANFFRNNSLRNERDIVLMDQRGTGASNAICSTIGNDMIGILAKDLTPEGEYQEMLKLLSECRSEVKKNNIDVSGYNSRENAADYEDLRKELGYEKWNVFGGSYGSRLAMTIMRDFPESVRSSTIFGIFAPETNLYANLVSNFKQSLFGVFEACENDPDCNQRYPDIKSQFFKTLNTLEQEPFSFRYNGEAFILNPQDMLLLTHQMLYSRSTMGLIPSFVKAINEGNSDVVRRALRPTANVSNLINFAMNMSMNAHDEIPFNNQANFLEDLKRNPEFAPGPAYFNSDAKLVEQWHSYRANAYENQPVVSDIPTFILNGRLDPVTPSQNARQAAKSLSNSYFAEFEMEGHSFFNSCFFEMSQQFLDHPDKQPDMSCINNDVRIDWN